MDNTIEVLEKMMSNVDANTDEYFALADAIEKLKFVHSEPSKPVNMSRYDLMVDIIKRSNPKNRFNFDYYRTLLEYKFKYIGTKLEIFKSISVSQINYELGDEIVDLTGHEIVALLDYFNLSTDYMVYQGYDEWIKDASYIDDLILVDKEG